MAAPKIDSSLKSILSVTLPMMLAVLSSNLMSLIDRFMLAGYSLDSMTAVVIAMNFVFTFTCLFSGIASSAEVLVGQYNGSRQYERLAGPTWQMIYMSAFACIPCALVAYFSDYLNLYPSYYAKDGVAYQKILLYVGALPSIKLAFASFFVGQGKTKIITVSVGSGAISNIVLDYLLIYGVGNVIPAMGCRGAAIATVISEFIQVFILAAIFFSKSNRQHYKTLQNRTFNKNLLKECIRIGLPVSLSDFVMVFAWYLMAIIIGHVSRDEATVYSICSALYVFFIFVARGVNKGTAAISSNMIGRRDLDSIEKVRKTFVKISLLFGAIFAVPLAICPEWLIQLISMVPDDISMLYPKIKVALALLAVDVTCETLLYSTWGILIAGGDSRYATIVDQACFWAITCVPMLVLYCVWGYATVAVLYVLATTSLVASQVLLYRRYKSLKWYNKLV
ncbi:MAG: MATE family efflux transporter [Holosporales bacterium]|jgi:MATE family multidrug resistance protein|nr:MATE family efflux transporter [Holosporales bacterium]